MQISEEIGIVPPSKFRKADGEWLRDCVWLTFTYYKEGDISSIYDCSVVGSANKCFIYQPFTFFIPVRGCVGSGPSVAL